MSATELNEFPSDAFRALLAISPKQLELIKRFMECSDEVQSVVRSMFAVLEYEYSTLEDKRRALSTIADALFLNPANGHGSYGIDLTRIERDTAKGHPVESRRPVVSNRLDQLDAQEASFADRLSKLLIEKNITQEELAHRIGCTQSAISKMLTRNARPRRTTIIKLSEALKVEPTELWPQLEVAAILDSVANAFADVELTPEQAKSLEAASLRSPARVKIRELPSRKRS
jgi:transcriptional regulator with XRE-family HTH domain